MTCCVCDLAASWEVFAAYDVTPSHNEPLIAAYPAPMHQVCDAHLPHVLRRDVAYPGSTGQWIVKPCAR